MGCCCGAYSRKGRLLDWFSMKSRHHHIQDVYAIAVLIWLRFKWVRDEAIRCQHSIYSIYVYIYIAHNRADANQRTAGLRSWVNIRVYYVNIRLITFKDMYIVFGFQVQRRKWATIMGWTHWANISAKTNHIWQQQQHDDVSWANISNIVLCIHIGPIWAASVICSGKSGKL